MERGGDFGQPGERRVRRCTQWRDRHQARQPQRAGARPPPPPPGPARGPGRPRRAMRRPAAGSPSRLTWSSTSTTRPCAGGSPVERRRQPDAVDGLHDVGVRATDRPCCVAAGPRSASRTRSPISAALGAASWSRFSPMSVTPRSARQRDVAGRVRLGDRDQGDLVRAPGGRAGGVDPGAYALQVGRQLGAPGVVSTHPVQAIRSRSSGSRARPRRRTAPGGPAGPESPAAAWSRRPAPRHHRLRLGWSCAPRPACRRACRRRSRPR